MKNAKQPSIQGLAFLIVFLDMIGFSIIFPLFPSMLEHYLALEGTGSAVGQLVARLDAWTAGDEFAVVTLFGGVLGSLYSALQFLFAPVWGALSDRYGRRPVLLLTLTGTALGFGLWVFAGTFALLVVARVLGGIMAGNISTASAAVADTTSGRDRAKGMAMIGIGIGLGFVIGPAIGAWLASYDLAGDSTAALRLNPFSAAALGAMALSLFNLVGVLRRFPETLPAERRGRREHVPALNPLGRLRRLSFPGVQRTNLVYLLFFTAFSAMEFTLVFLAVERFAYSHARNAVMFSFVGIVMALVQGGIVRRMAPRVGEKRLSVTGLALIIPGFLLVGLARGQAALFGGLFLMASGSALATPCLSALVSRYAPAERQGIVLGVFRSMGSLSRAVGPLMGGLLYWKFGSAAPYLAGAAFLVLPLGLALALPPVPDHGPDHGPGPGPDPGHEPGAGPAS